MKTAFISLGSGCDIASALERMKLRDDSYPFDWWWNFDTGLEAVTQIIQTDFVSIKSRNAFELADHYRFPEKKSIVFAHYPAIVHLHSDPMHRESDWLTQNRRIDRFQQVMLDDDIYVNFIHYRIFEEAWKKRPTASMEDEFCRLKQEGKNFYELIKTKYPGKKFRLILVFQTEPQYQKDAKALVNDSNVNKTDPAIYYDYTFARNDENEIQDKQRKKQWHQAISKNGYFPMPAIYYKVISPLAWRIKRVLKGVPGK